MGVVLINSNNPEDPLFKLK